MINKYSRNKSFNASILVCAALLLSFSLPDGDKKNDNINWVATKSGHIHIQTYKGDSISNKPGLVFVLHGDAPTSSPNGQYALAKLIADKNKNVIAIGILRPGYTDADNNTSEGMKGLAVGDNYTADRIKAIAEVIEELKKKYNPGHTVLIGHSGGAAIAADLVALYPGLVNSAVLVSGPFYVQEWRSYMLTKENSSPQWSMGVSSISPDQVADKISDSTKIVIVSGDQDSVVPHIYSVNYYNYLISKNKLASLITVPHRGHQILFDNSVLKSVGALIKQ